MPTPQYYGSVSVPLLGAFASATSVPALFSGAIQTGPSSLSVISVGDIESSRSATTGAHLIGGVTERAVLDFGIANAHGTTITGIGASATSNLFVPGAAQTGPAPLSGISVGDLNATRSASTGAIVLGGGSDRGVLDFGVTSVGAFTISRPTGASVTLNTGPVATSGTITATSYIASGPSNAASISVGDLNASRSTTSGAILLGGASGRGVLDYGVTFSNWLTLSAQTDVLGPLQAMRAGAAVQSYVPPCYLNNGTTTPNTLHAVVGQVTAGGASTTVTLTGAAVFGTLNMWFVADVTSGQPSLVTLSTASLTQVAFSSTLAHVYNYFSIGY